MQISLDIIKVGQRFRQRFEGIEELAESIKRFGLIEPIVLDENHNLIAGERRLRAHKILNKATIEAKYIKDLNPVEKREVELEENIQRENFTWQEEVDAKAELHKIKQAIHGAGIKGLVQEGGWGLRDTAEALGESLGKTTQDIKLAKAMDKFPELAKEKTKSAAYKRLLQLEEKMLTQELLRRHKLMATVKKQGNLYNGDCLQVMKDMDSESVDLILTDPPYGIDVDDSHAFERLTPVATGFDDDKIRTLILVGEAAKEFYRILKMNRHCYAFCAIELFPEIRALFEEAGFYVHPMPLIWDKGSGSYPSQQTSFVHSYEAFLHISKGKRRLNGTPRDVFPIKRVASNLKLHPTEKPTELLKELITYSTDPGEIVLDPFAGSGSTLAAAKELERIPIGIEFNPIYFDALSKRLS